MGALSFSQPNHQQHQRSPAPPPDSTEQDLSPEEFTKREKVRAAARERQKKHRALVKDRKMKELGLDMGNEISEVQYRDGQYQQVLAHELQHNPHGVLVHQEPPFPEGQQLGPGETFASMLLLSFSCTPLLKQHVLSTLQMTNEELTSLGPIIADAWDRWDRQRRLHYAQQTTDAAKSPGPIPGPSSTYAPVDQHMSNGTSSTSYANEHAHPQQSASEFRTRFQRPLVAPSPFRTFTADTQTTTPTSTGTSNASGPPSDGIDPHLSEGRPPLRVDSSDLMKARSEAEGVVGRLERA